MPKITDIPTPAEHRAELERQAAEVNAKLDAIRADEERQLQEAARRRAEAEAEADRQFIATVTTADLEADVDQATRALSDALAVDPLVVALADYLTALRRRSNLWQELSSARMRVGLDALGPKPAGMATEIAHGQVVDLVLQAAGRIAADRVSAEVADLYAQRTAAGDAAAEQG